MPAPPSGPAGRTLGRPAGGVGQDAGGLRDRRRAASGRAAPIYPTRPDVAAPFPRTVLPAASAGGYQGSPGDPDWFLVLDPEKSSVAWRSRDVPVGPVRHAGRADAADAAAITGLTPPFAHPRPYRTDPNLRLRHVRWVSPPSFYPSRTTEDPPMQTHTTAYSRPEAATTPPRWTPWRFRPRPAASPPPRGGPGRCCGNCRRSRHSRWTSGRDEAPDDPVPPKSGCSTRSLTGCGVRSFSEVGMPLLCTTRVLHSRGNATASRQGRQEKRGKASPKARFFSRRPWRLGGRDPSRQEARPIHRALCDKVSIVRKVMRRTCACRLRCRSRQRCRTTAVSRDA